MSVPKFNTPKFEPRKPVFPIDSAFRPSTSRSIQNVAYATFSDNFGADPLKTSALYADLKTYIIYSSYFRLRSFHEFVQKS